MYQSIPCLSRTTPRTGTGALLSTLLFVVLLWAQLVLVAEAVAGTAYYVSPDGSDLEDLGTIGAPFATLQKAHDVAVAGDTIYLRGGTYTVSSGIIFTRSGSNSNPINVYAYPGETPILDGFDINTLDTWVLSLRGTASWWHIKGLEIKNNPHGGGILVRGTASNNIIENNNIHDNGSNSEWAASGISVYDSPANNLFLNNDVHNNRDIDGGDADGISGGNTGSGNVYRGNRAWQNSDDGYDFFCVQDGATCKAVLFENNWAWENGYDATLTPLGNGIGIKLGGKRSNTHGKSGGHMVKNNLSWKNVEGFDDNNSSATAAESLPNTLYNNTAWSNELNYVFWAPTKHIFRNNLNVLPGELRPDSMLNPTTYPYNSWTLPVTVNLMDFVSLDDGVDSCVRGPRQTDGSLPNCDFLHLADRSDLIDMGTNVGIPFVLLAPDLGAFEKGQEHPATTILWDPFEYSLSWTKTGDATWYTGTPKNGTHSVRLSNIGSIQKTIPLTGYSNITVSFTMGAYSLDSNIENLQALYFDGSDWVELATIANNSANENNKLNLYSILLPSSVNNLASFAIGFKINGNDKKDYGFIDDVTVMGMQ